MSPKTFRRSALALGIAAATLVASVTPAHARPDAGETGITTPATSTVYSITDSLAKQVASTLTNRASRDRIVSATADGAADLATLARGSALASAVHDANQAVLVAKGLPATSGSVLRLRLAHEDMRAPLRRAAVPLVAAAPTDDVVTAVVAYRPTGQPVLLDATRIPQQPVFVIEVDVAKTLPLGMALLRQELAVRGITSAPDAATAARATDTQMTASAGYWATKVTAVRLKDDKEPWVKGAAEIYNLVAGFGLDGKVKVDVVEMPYLDHDNTTYYPNQLLVHFSAYKYNLADVVMMEDDGDTNYQALARAIANALLFIVDGGAYTPLVNAIIDAIPGSWWTDDPDYVDSWYTLSTGSNGRLYGAANNGWLDVVPHWVQQF